MKYTIRGLACGLIFSATSLFADGACCNNLLIAKDWNYAKTHWTERPAGQQYFIYGGAGVQDKINLYGKCEFYGVFDVALVYEQTAHPGRNSSYFASCDGLLYLGPGQGGSMPNAEPAPNNAPWQYKQGAAVGSAPLSIRASDLGLAAPGVKGIAGIDALTATPGYSGTFCFQPKIQNFVANLDLWLGFDEFAQGFFGRIRLPINWTRWDIGLTARNETIDNTPIIAGYVAPITIAGTPAVPTIYYPPITSGAVALSGQTSLPGLLPKLCYGRICGRDDDAGLADIPMDLGYNFLLNERGRMGIALHVVAPTGTKNDRECIFAPRFGFGRWQVGGQFGAQYQFWNCDESYMTVYVEAMVSALCARTQRRLLGLKANNTYAFNHFLLLKKYNSTGTVIGLERAANLLFQDIKLGTSINSDIAVWWQYRRGGLDFSLAYQFTGRSAEKLLNSVKCDNDRSFIPVPCATFGDSSSYYVIKGDTPMYLATYGGGAYTGSVVDNHFYNKADSDIRVLGTISPNATYPAQGAAMNVANLATYAFKPEDVVANPTLAPTAITNAVAFYLGYNWCECDWQPFVGGGAQYEFGQDNTSMSMWAIYAKGGVAF